MASLRRRRPFEPPGGAAYLRCTATALHVFNDRQDIERLFGPLGRELR